jgi:hypothetical protein
MTGICISSGMTQGAGPRASAATASLPSARVEDCLTVARDRLRDQRPDHRVIVDHQDDPTPRRSMASDLESPAARAGIGEVAPRLTYHNQRA